MSKPVKKRRRNTIWFVLIGAVLVILILLVVSGGNDLKSVTVENAARRVIVSSVSESGTVEPATEVKIAPDVSGEVVELHFKEGDRVKRGDLLAVIRPDNYQAALDQSEAALNAAIAQSMQAEQAWKQAIANVLQDSANYVRNDQLLREKVISRQEFETFKLKLDISRAQRESAWQGVQASKFQVESSRANQRQARQNLNRTTIHATMDGTLTRLASKVGERVVGTMQMQGTEMLRIADLSRMLVKVPINENDIKKIEMGDSAHITIDAYGEKEFKGRVIEIAYSPSSAAGTISLANTAANYEVKVEIDAKSYQNDPDVMRGRDSSFCPFNPGMNAQVEIFTERVENVVSVPIAAVMVKKERTGDSLSATEQTIEYVYLLSEDMRAVETPVTTGLSDNTYIEVKTGMNEGQKVISGPYIIINKGLKNNEQVTLLRTRKKKEDSEAAK